MLYINSDGMEIEILIRSTEYTPHNYRACCAMGCFRVDDNRYAPYMFEGISGHRLT